MALIADRYDRRRGGPRKISSTGVSSPLPLFPNTNPGTGARQVRPRRPPARPVLARGGTPPAGAALAPDRGRSPRPGQSQGRDSRRAGPEKFKGGVDPRPLLLFFLATLERDRTRFARGPSGRPASAQAARPYLAKATALVSRMTVTLI